MCFGEWTIVCAYTGILLIIIMVCIICSIIKCCKANARKNNPSSTAVCRATGPPPSTPMSPMGLPFRVGTTLAPNHQTNASFLSNSAHASVLHNSNQRQILDPQQPNMFRTESISVAGQLFEIDPKDGHYYPRVDFVDLALPTYEEAMQDSRKFPGNNVLS